MGKRENGLGKTGIILSSILTVLSPFHSMMRGKEPVVIAL